MRFNSHTSPCTNTTAQNKQTIDISKYIRGELLAIATGLVSLVQHQYHTTVVVRRQAKKRCAFPRKER